MSIIRYFLCTILIGFFICGEAIMVRSPEPEVVFSMEKMTKGEGQEVEKLILYAEAFWVGEDETVYLLDAYGRKIVCWNGKQVTYIQLSDSMLPTDMIYKNEEFYIYDESEQELEIYDKKGNLLFVKKVVLEQDYVKGLEEREEEVVLITYGGKEWFANRTNGALLSRDKSVETVEIIAKGDFSEYLGTDANGNIYSANTTLVSESSIITGEISISVVSPKGKVFGNYYLPLEQYTYLPKRYVQVKENGSVYILIPMENAYEVWELPLYLNSQSRMEQVQQEAIQKEEEYAKENKAPREKVSLTREEMLKRANSIVNHSWQMKKENVTIIYSQGSILTRQIQFIQEENKDKKSWEVSMVGIPYCWGGFNSLYNPEENKRFDYLIQKKAYTAGNINTEEYYIYYTAGLDCSGYVGAVYGMNTKVNTTSFSDMGTKIVDRKKLQSMDMIVAPADHIMLFCDWIDEGTWLVTEATIRDGKTVTHPKRLNELLVFGSYQMRSPW